MKISYAIAALVAMVCMASIVIATPPPPLPSNEATVTGTITGTQGIDSVVVTPNPFPLAQGANSGTVAVAVHGNQVVTVTVSAPNFALTASPFTALGHPIVFTDSNTWPAYPGTTHTYSFGMSQAVTLDDPAGAYSTTVTASI